MNEFEYIFLESYLEGKKSTDSIIHTKWCAISGAPCSGKTTVINELAKQGFCISPDIARRYIESEIKKGLSKTQVRADLKRFRRIIFLKMFENISNLPTNCTIFHDYALPDNIAFYEIDKIDLTKDLCESVKKYEYAKIFFLDPLPLWEDDVRIEDEYCQTMLDKKMRDVYARLGYEIIKIPIMPVKDRINKILNYI